MAFRGAAAGDQRSGWLSLRQYRYDNKTLYVPALKQDRICLFTLCENGQLTPRKQPQVTTVEGAGPRHMEFHPSGQYAYCVNELDSTVDVWELNMGKVKLKACRRWI